MRKIWPYATIRELLAHADAYGEAKAELASAREAILFRYAIYSYRKVLDRTDPLLRLSITIDDKTVIVQKRVELFIVPMHEHEQVED